MISRVDKVIEYILRKYSRTRLINNKIKLINNGTNADFRVKNRLFEEVVSRRVIVVKVRAAIKEQEAKDPKRVRKRINLDA